MFVQVCFPEFVVLTTNVKLWLAAKITLAQVVIVASILILNFALLMPSSENMQRSGKFHVGN